MSTLRCTNLQDTSGSNSSTTSEIKSGRVKAWVNFNGQGAVAIRAQFNVSSITDNGTGDYTVNYSPALSDANYVFYGSIVSATSATSIYSYSFISGPASTNQMLHTTSATRFNTTHIDGPTYDHEMVQVAVNGN